MERQQTERSASINNKNNHIFLVSLLLLTLSFNGIFDLTEQERTNLQGFSHSFECKSILIESVPKKVLHKAVKNEYFTWVG